ncbi:MAG: 23S rRNA (pseudouridine(1915)-N(3))-methyltransferase RlmH [Pseudomonadota bacterium]
MQLNLLCVGKMKAGPERELVARYLDRVKKTAPQCGMSFGRVYEVTESQSGDARERKAQEAASFEKQINAPRSALIILDETGKQMKSRQWASTLQYLREDNRPHCNFAIGGPDGHDPSMLQRATLAVSLGRQTMPHQLVRIILSEQIYRACTILTNHPYHRD